MSIVRLDHALFGAGTNLLLLHGGGGSRDDLFALRNALAERHRVIAPDQRMHGRSPDPGDATYELMAGDTAALLDELGVPEVDVVGWSDGGIIALILARDRPHLVRRIVAMGANVDWAEDHQEDVWTDDALTTFERLSSHPETWPKPDAYMGTAEDWRGVVERLIALWRRPPGVTLDELRSIQAKVLFLAGEEDDVRLEHTLAMWAAAPNASLGIIPGTSHLLPEEVPDIVAGLIERFLTDP